MSVAKYAAWELDLHSDQPKVYMGLPSLHEVCFMLRVRERLPIEELSDSLNGMDPALIRDMELGKVPCAALIEYWNEQGKL